MKVLLYAILMFATVATARAQTTDTVMVTGNLVTSPSNVTFLQLRFGSFGMIDQGTNATNLIRFWIGTNNVSSLGTNGFVFPSESVSAARSNLGFSTNLSGLWTATNYSNARSAIGLSLSAFTNTNVSGFTAAIGLGEQSTNRFAAVKIGGTNISFESSIEDNGIKWYFNRGTNAPTPAITLGYLSNSILSFLPVQFDTETAAAQTRTNLGLGASWLAATDVADFRSEIGLGGTNEPAFQGGTFQVLTVNEELFADSIEVVSGGNTANSMELTGSGIIFTGITAQNTRSSLGLGLSTLTNTTKATFMADILPDYTNNANQVLAVNSSEDGLVWTTRFPDLSGNSNNVLFVNSAESGVEWRVMDLDAIGLGEADTVTFEGVKLGQGGNETSIGYIGGGGLEFGWGGTNDMVQFFDSFSIKGIVLNYEEAAIHFENNDSGAAITRTNLGLGGGLTTNITVLRPSNVTNTLRFTNGILGEVTVP